MSIFIQRQIHRSWQASLLSILVVGLFAAGFSQTLGAAGLNLPINDLSPLKQSLRKIRWESRLDGYEEAVFLEGAPLVSLVEIRRQWFEFVVLPLLGGADAADILGEGYEEDLALGTPLLELFAVDAVMDRFDREFWARLGGRLEVDVEALQAGRISKITDATGRALGINSSFNAYEEVVKLLEAEGVQLGEDPWPGSTYTYYVYLGLQAQLVHDLRRLGANQPLRAMLFGPGGRKERLATAAAELKAELAKAETTEERSLLKEWQAQVNRLTYYVRPGWIPRVVDLIELDPSLDRSGQLGLDIFRYEKQDADGLYYRTLVDRVFGEAARERVVENRQTRAAYRQAWSMLASIGRKETTLYDHTLLLREGLKESLGFSMDPWQLDPQRGLSVEANDELRLAYESAYQMLWEHIAKDRSYPSEYAGEVRLEVGVDGDPEVSGDLLMRRYASRSRFNPLDSKENFDYEDIPVPITEILRDPFTLVADLAFAPALDGGTLLLTAKQQLQYLAGRDELRGSAWQEALSDLMIPVPIGKIAAIRYLPKLRWWRRGRMVRALGLWQGQFRGQPQVMRFFNLGVASNMMMYSAVAMHDRLMSGQSRFDLHDFATSSRDAGLLTVLSFGALSRFSTLRSRAALSGTLFGVSVTSRRLQGGSWTASLLVGTKMGLLPVLPANVLLHRGVSFGAGVVEHELEGGYTSRLGRPAVSAMDAGVSSALRFWPVDRYVRSYPTTSRATGPQGLVPRPIAPLGSPVGLDQGGPALALPAAPPAVSPAASAMPQASLPIVPVAPLLNPGLPPEPTPLTAPQVEVALPYRGDTSERLVSPLREEEERLREVEEFERTLREMTPAEKIAAFERYRQEHPLITPDEFFRNFNGYMRQILNWQPQNHSTTAMSAVNQNGDGEQSGQGDGAGPVDGGEEEEEEEGRTEEDDEAPARVDHRWVTRHTESSMYAPLRALDAYAWTLLEPLHSPDGLWVLQGDRMAAFQSVREAATEAETVGDLRALFARLEREAQELSEGRQILTVSVVANDLLANAEVRRPVDERGLFTGQPATWHPALVGESVCPDDTTGLSGVYWFRVDSSDSSRYSSGIELVNTASPLELVHEAGHFYQWLHALALGDPQTVSDYFHHPLVLESFWRVFIELEINLATIVPPEGREDRGSFVARLEAIGTLIRWLPVLRGQVASFDPNELRPFRSAIADDPDASLPEGIEQDLRHAVADARQSWHETVDRMHPEGADAETLDAIRVYAHAVIDRFPVYEFMVALSRLESYMRHHHLLLRPRDIVEGQPISPLAVLWAEINAIQLLVLVDEYQRGGHHEELERVLDFVAQSKPSMVQFRQYWLDYLDAPQPEDRRQLFWTWFREVRAGTIDRRDEDQVVELSIRNIEWQSWARAQPEEALLELDAFLRQQRADRMAEFFPSVESFELEARDLVPEGWMPTRESLRAVMEVLSRFREDEAATADWARVFSVDVLEVFVMSGASTRDPYQQILQRYNRGMTDIETVRRTHRWRGRDANNVFFGIRFSDDNSRVENAYLITPGGSRHELFPR